MAPQQEMNPSEERRQVLLYAAEHSRSDVASKALEEEAKAPGGGDIPEMLAFQADPQKGTALHIACRLGHVDVVRLLLNRCAPADVRDGSGKTPFEAAMAEAPGAKRQPIQGAFEAELFKRCATGDTKGAESLVRGGLGLNCEQGGYSPMAWAELFDCTETAERLKKLESGVADDEEPEAEAASAQPAGGGEPAEETSPVKNGRRSAAASGLGMVSRRYPFTSLGKSVEHVPYIWPPLQGGVALWPCEEATACPSFSSTASPAAAAKKVVELPLSGQLPMALELPQMLSFSEQTAIKAILEDALAEAAALAARSFRTGAKPPPRRGGFLAPQLKLPTLLAWPSLNDDAEEEASQDKGCSPQRRCAAASIPVLSFVYGTRPFGRQVPGTFRLTITPGSADGGAGRIEAAAPDSAGLRSAAQVLSQLLRHHGDLALASPTVSNGSRWVHPQEAATLLAPAPTLSLPALVLADEGDATGQVGGASLLFDVWRLWPLRTHADALEPPAGLLAALDLLARWRVGRLLVDLPMEEAVPLHLRVARLLTLKTACEHRGLAIVPVITISKLDEPLHKSLDAQALLQLLAQLQDASASALGSAGVVARIAGHSAEAAATTASSIVARASEVQCCVAAAGLGGPLARGLPAAVQLWLSAECCAKADLLEQVARLLSLRELRASDSAIYAPWQRPTPLASPILGLSVMLETKLVDWVPPAGGGGLSEEAERAAGALALLAERGVPVRFLATLPRAHVGTAAGAGEEVAGLPAHIWPQPPARARAAAIAALCESSLRGSLGLVEAPVIQVPTFGHPWCGPAAAEVKASSAVGGGGAAATLSEGGIGQAGAVGWCRLSAFLAAGLASGYSKVATEALGLQGSKSTSAEQPGSQQQLGELLGQQLLPPVPGTETLSRPSCGSLALALWDSSAALPAPEGLLQPLLSLLSGRMPCTLGDTASREAAIKGVNSWYTLLAGRRDLLQPWAEQISKITEDQSAEGTTGAGAADDVALLPGALLGMEWLRFACRLLLVLAKHAPGAFESAAQGARDADAAFRQLQTAVQSLPVTKHSDLRNSFLRVVERAAGLSPGNYVDGTPRSSPGGGAPQDLEADRLAATCQSLWCGGVRLGAALGLDPWVGFLAEEKGTDTKARLLVA
eukprot:TRINITY_DN59372_c0_g1_i1.p1 TRINITY_DN59372_c0_g1~~TRINITY_DN59372_c0_g1_i1.p1  ORF type:complete len:1143 (+),score=287.08 TRINITY_DN59372_c0_g1_i1:82-3510(+)